MKKYNLLYIFADQLRYQSCGYSGDVKARTPNIDSLAKESVDFCNAVSGHPVCAAYRASLFTGKYTTSTGMVINEIQLNPNQRCIGHVLHDGGYDTPYIGKWHLYASVLGDHELSRNSFVPRGEHRLGFDDYWASYGFHHEYYGKNAYYHEENKNKIHYKDNKYEPDAQTDMAIDILKKHDKEKPFAMFLSLGTPHDPWTPKNVSKKYLKMFDKINFEKPENYLPDNDPYADKWACLSVGERKKLTSWMKVYYAMVANLDYNIGRVMKALDKAGLAEDTIVVFTSDHGELFGSHGRRAKNIFYEEAVRVPFLMRLPKVFKPSKNDVCLNSVDIMPTVLSLLNLPIPKEVEGTDLSGFIKGAKKKKSETVKIEEPEFALMMCTGPTAIFKDGHEWRAVRDKQFTYAIFKVDGKELLFDNISDPLQINNLIGDPKYKDVHKRLKAGMKKKMSKIKDTFENNTYYEKKWIVDRKIIKTATSDFSAMKGKKQNL